jgi:anti-sigma28 factor (negative regulator of flagellin synthesis)
MLRLQHGDLPRAQAAIRQTPEVRAERVAALRSRIASGAYYIPDSLLAQKLLAYRI